MSARIHHILSAILSAPTAVLASTRSAWSEFSLAWRAARGRRRTMNRLKRMDRRLLADVGIERSQLREVAAAMYDHRTQVPGTARVSRSQVLDTHARAPLTGVPGSGIEVAEVLDTHQATAFASDVVDTHRPIAPTGPVPAL